MADLDDELMLDKLSDEELKIGNPHKEEGMYAETVEQENTWSESNREGLSSVAEVPPVLR